MRLSTFLNVFTPPPYNGANFWCVAELALKASIRKSFSLSPCIECFDYINIITSVNGTEEELQGQFCGTSLSKVGICFRATKVTLRFVTDNAFNLRGFKMAFMVSGSFVVIVYISMAPIDFSYRRSLALLCT